MKLIDNFFEIVSAETTADEYRCRVRMNAAHYLYGVHFPGNPVTPGVCLVQMATEILGKKYGKELQLFRSRSIKFKHPLLPGDEPTFVFTKVKTADDTMSANVDIVCGQTQFATMSLQCKAAEQRRLCTIIPTYNNAATLAQVVESVRNYCSDVIVVNDGSTDATANVLASLSDKVTIVAYERNRGKGHALVAGFRKALEMGFTHAITIDADGQHFADDILSLTDALSTCGNGIIVGARNLTEENMPRQNTFANKFSNFWFRLQTGVNLPDTQSGYRLYTLSALHGLSLITSRYEAELELLVYAAWAGVSIAWVPVKVYYPPADERVSHFRPVYDFVRISILNTVFCAAALVYGYPRRLLGKMFHSA